jgi:hypothetical protein
VTRESIICGGKVVVPSFVTSLSGRGLRTDRHGRRCSASMHGRIWHSSMGKQTDVRREACSDNDSMVSGDVNFYLANERLVFHAFVCDSHDYIFISYVNGYFRSAAQSLGARLDLLVGIICFPF